MNALSAALLVSSSLAFAAAPTPTRADAGVADAGQADTTLAEIRRISVKVEAAVKAPWVKTWVHAANELKPVPNPGKTWFCNREVCEKTAFDGGTARQVTDEMYYARVADPLGYVRPFEVLAEHGVVLGQGSKVVDLGYGSIGHLQMLNALGVSCAGIEVNPLLPIMYADAQSPTLRILHGSFPQNAEMMKALGTGFDLFMSKNTLKRGYVHPDPETKAKPQIEFGKTDVEVMKIAYDLLKPGGYFYIYNFSPPPAPPGKPFIPWSDGRSAFTRDVFEKAGFEVVAFDVDDSKEGGAFAKLMEWDVSDSSATPGVPYTINAHYTLVRRPLAKGSAPKAKP